MLEIKEKVENAKMRVIESYELRKTTERQWLEAILDSYGDEANRVKVLVLEGSPSKGTVLINYSRMLVLSVDSWGNVLKW